MHPLHRSLAPGSRVFLVLALAGVLAAPTLPFVTLAANRLVGGSPIGLGEVMSGIRGLALLPTIALLLSPFAPPRRLATALIAAMALLFLVTLLALAGAAAAELKRGAPPAARVSLGSGVWALFILGALMLAEAMRRLHLPPALRLAIGAAAVAALALLAAVGALDQLSVMAEYAARRSEFLNAVGRHIEIVLGALLPTLLLGFPLGVAAHRRPGLGTWLFPGLNIVQTIPSIALFGLLIAPLSALAARWSIFAEWGIGGVGLTPALIALCLYLLLPIARNTAAGLASVSPAALEAAQGMGMSRGQIFRLVELPLALPVLLSGVRIALVQAVGLAAVAALIGAGGLGAIMFDGLFAYALDLVLLGAVPIILMALAADALLRVAASGARRLAA